MNPLLPRQSISFRFRGTSRHLLEVDPGRTLLDWLREEQRATGTKEGCNEGDCGACTVVLARLRDGRLHYAPVNACILLLGQIDGAEILTVEDLASAEGGLHPVQQAMVTHHGAQCGFCTPGIIMSLFAAYHEEPRPVTRERISETLAGNLCRCTGYRPIIDAAMDALGESPADAFTAAAPERRAALAALADDADLLVGTTERFFAAPRTIERLAALLHAHPDAQLVAGATDLGLWLTKRLRDLPKLIWLGRVAGLDRIEEDDTHLHLGATVTHAAALPALAALDPDLGTLMRRFGSRQVRASGTIGGNIANGSPIGDLAPALIALGATLHLRKAQESRQIPLEDFFLAYGRQDRAPGEFVAGLSVPKLGGGRHFRCFKLSKRMDEDISTVMGAFLFEVEDQHIRAARIAFGGMAATPRRALATEAALIGVACQDAQAWTPAMRALSEDFTPISDMRASAAYRTRTARALLGKALLEVAGTRAATRLHPRQSGAAHDH